MSAAEPVRADPPRVAPELAERSAAYGVATVHEAQARRGLLQSHVRPVWPWARAAGTAVTVSVRPAGDRMIHREAPAKEGLRTEDASGG